MEASATDIVRQVLGSIFAAGRERAKTTPHYEQTGEIGSYQIIYPLSDHLAQADAPGRGTPPTLEVDPKPPGG